MTTNEEPTQYRRAQVGDRIVSWRSGYWHLFALGLRYGGPEEGGWWRECGETIAVVPSTRACWATIGEHGERVAADPVEWVEGPAASDSGAVAKAAIEAQLGDDDYDWTGRTHRHTSSRRESVAWAWRESVVEGFGDGGGYE